jgi:hypothetical protein
LNRPQWTERDVSRTERSRGTLRSSLEGDRWHRHRITTAVFEEGRTRRPSFVATTRSVVVFKDEWIS